MKHKGKIILKFLGVPINKKMSTRRLKLLMIKLRAKNYLCFPTMNDKQFKTNFISDVYILRSDICKDSLVLHAHKLLSGWDVWYDEHIYI